MADRVQPRLARPAWRSRAPERRDDQTRLTEFGDVVLNDWMRDLFDGP